jgi:hypothetical protein
MDEKNSFRLDRTAFSVAKLTDPSDEIDYWLSKTVDERLEAAEYLRQSIYGYDPADARLQRVFEIVRNPWG